jgi:Carboxypeptidase regulatory-like domain
MLSLKRAGLACVLTMVVCIGSALIAQQFQGSFTGTVSDSSGASVPGVTVTATEADQGYSRSAVTKDAGSYEIPLLPPGNYRLTAAKRGFENISQGPMALTVNAHLKVDFQLTVGSQTTTVTVESTAPILDTQTYSVGTTVEQAKVSQLPFNGRHFLEATLFTPGVVPGSEGSELNSNRGGSINVNGMRETMNTYLQDGMSDTSIAVGTYSATPPLDSIQEFRMETGVYDAKFGNQAGAQINMVTKSGTNQLHGSLYEYLRNNNLDARNYFEPFTPPFHRNQYGVSLGGPITIPRVYNGHDRTFFFVNYEGLRDDHSFFSRAHVPTVAERNGDFSELLPGGSCPSNVVLLDPLILFDSSAPLTVPNNDVSLLAPGFPSGTLDPVGQAMGNLYPDPNIAGAGCGQENYTAVVRRLINTNSYVGRIDQRWGAKDSLFYRMNVTGDYEVSPSGLPTGLPGFGALRHDNFIATGVDWTHTFTPTLLNETKIDYNRWQYRWVNQDQGRLVAQQLGLNAVPQTGRDTGVPNLSFGGFDGLGADTSIPQAGAVNTFEFADTITKIHGNHTFDFGTQIRSIKRGNFYEDITARSQYDFTGAVTGDLVLAGLQQSLPPSTFAQLALEIDQACPGSIPLPGVPSPPAGTPLCTLGNGLADGLFGIPTDWIDGSSGYISGTGGEYDLFGQDSWKARRDLTVTLGLRYEFNTPVTDKANHLGGFDFNTNVCGSPGAVMVAGNSAAALDCFVGTISSASGLPVGQFQQMGTINLGSSSANRALQRPDRNNFGPRIGLAWQPFGSTKTVIRGGFGTYYDQMVGELYFQKSFNPPFFTLSSGNLQDNFSQVLGALSTPPQQGGLPLGTGLLIQNVFASPLLSSALFPTMNPVIVNLQDSKVFQWSMDVQREMGSSWLLDVGYVGTRGLHLPYEWDPNQPDDSVYATDPAQCNPTCPRLFPNFIGQSYTDSSGKSIYHSLQVKVERHYTNGLAVIGAYTYSKTLDTNSTYFSTNGNANFPQDSYNRAAEKGLADFDHRQRLSIAYIYDLPFGTRIAHSQSHALNFLIEGWQLSGIAMAQSGAPYTVTAGSNPSHNPNGDDRPNVVSGQPFYPAHQTVNHWANVSAFSTPAQYTYGNAARDLLIGPGEEDWDFSVIRKFRLSESAQLEFRAEMFNIFNEANFTLPNGNMNDTNFGVIGNTVQPIAGQASGGPGDPREIQFALRLTW